MTTHAWLALARYRLDAGELDAANVALDRASARNAEGAALIMLRARHALLAGDTARAAESLASLRDSTSRNDPLVRELEARRRLRDGHAAEVFESLQQLRTAEPARLETITALIDVARDVQPDLVPPLLAEGRRILAQRAPVATVFRQGRFTPRSGLLTAPGVRAFEAAAAKEAAPLGSSFGSTSPWPRATRAQLER